MAVDNKSGGNAAHWVTVVCAVLSLAGAVVTGYLGYSAGTAPSNIEMTKLALGMLGEPETPPALREWAIDVLGSYTSVPVSPDRRRELSNVIQKSGGVDLKGGRVRPVKPVGLIPPSQTSFEEISPELYAISKALYKKRTTPGSK